MVSKVLFELACIHAVQLRSVCGPSLVALLLQVAGAVNIPWNLLRRVPHMNVLSVSLVLSL